MASSRLILFVTKNFYISYPPLYSVFPHAVFNRYFCSSKESDTNETKLKSASASSDIKQNEDTKLESESTKLRKKLELSSSDTKEEAKKKLLSLISDIPTQPLANNSSKLNLARPLKRLSKAERFPPPEKKDPDEEIKTAVKDVASSLKGDATQIVSELNEKLSSMNVIQDNVSEQNENNTDENEIEEKVDRIMNYEINKNVMSSVQDIASALGKTPIEPKSELTKRLLRLAIDQKETDRKISSDLFHGMKVESKYAAKQKKSTVVHDQDTKQLKDPQKRSMLSRKDKPHLRSPPERIDLFGASPLGIFSTDEKDKTEAKNTLWQTLQEKELRLLVQYAPANAFEEMIMWTEQGKHWKFPIDNEIDIGAEENVGFHEHVFFDHHLEGFPKKGPIRHFMELVVVGLSKNPYITVERKVENINWFRNYFKEKEEILKQCEVIN